MSENLLQIGEFAKRANTNLRTLRYYEELGLIKPVRRSAGRFRFYSQDQIKRIAAVKRLQALGLTLTEVQELMVGSDDGSGDPTPRLVVSLDRQLDLVDRRMRSLQGERDELSAARAKLEECRPCEQAFGSEVCVACTADQPDVYSALGSLV